MNAPQNLNWNVAGTWINVREGVFYSLTKTDWVNIINSEEADTTSTWQHISFRNLQQSCSNDSEETRGKRKEHV